MPRPAVKRNHPASKASPPTVFEKGAIDQTSLANDKPELADSPKSPYAPRPADSTFISNTNFQHMENQTPISKGHEQAIESSPMGERAATGSRVPTRARGYSSTLSIAGRKGDMSSKIPGTPAFESSVLSNFRKRARQPSILQMMQTEDGSSDLDDDNFLGGISPEDESTPLNVSCGKSLVIRQAASSPKSLSPFSEGPRKRKRAAEGVQVPQSPLGVVESTPTSSPVQETRETEPAGTPRAIEPLEAFSQTMALPMSSSVSLSPAHNALASTSGQTSPATSEPTKEPSGQTRSRQEPLSTAMLQGKLLPRRRRRQRKQHGAPDFDISSDDSGNISGRLEKDDDGLNVLSKRTMKSQHQHADRLKSFANYRDKPEDQKRKPSKLSKGAIAYSSNINHGAGGGKEDRPSDDPSSLSSVIDSDGFDSDASISRSRGNFMSEELRLQAKKFAEVDKWQMNFEDVASATESPGSSFR